jgi:acylphosphatase
MGRILEVQVQARNLPDGTVEVLLLGEESKVNELQNWLWQGPPRARVEKVNCDTLEEASFWERLE